MTNDIPNIVTRRHPVFGEIASYTDNDGKRFYDATTVAKALGYKRPQLAVYQFCKDQPLLVLPLSEPHGHLTTYRKRFCDIESAFYMALRGKTSECEALRKWIYHAIFPLLEDLSRNWLKPYKKEDENSINSLMAFFQCVDGDPVCLGKRIDKTLIRLIENNG